MSPRMKRTRSANPASRANIVRQDHDATLTRLDTDHGVGGLAIVSALEKTLSLRPVENDDAEPSVQILALLARRHVRLEKRKQMSRTKMTDRAWSSGARSCT